MAHSVSRAAKPLGYYVNTSNESIATLIRVYGDYLEGISPQQKCLMGAAIFDHMAAAHYTYPMQSSIEAIDPDNLLGDHLKFLLIEIAAASDADELNSLIVAIAAQHGDDVRNGAYD